MSSERDMGNREPGKSPPPSPETELGSERDSGNLEGTEHRRTNDQGCEKHPTKPISNANGRACVLAHEPLLNAIGPTNGHPQVQMAAGVPTQEPEPEQASHSVDLIQSATVNNGIGGFIVQKTGHPAHGHIPECHTSGSRENHILTTRPREVTFRILLHCVPEKRQKEKHLDLKDYPTTTLELKESIQSKFSVPARCQRLYFESVLIRDDERLDSHRIRDGDTLQVHYNSEGDVEDVLEIISSMREMVPFLESIQPELTKGVISRELEMLIIRSVKAPKVESLPSKYFWPCATERANANRLLFVSNDGLDLMHQLHVILLQQPWENTPLAMQLLEHAILRTLWNITATFSIRTQVLRRPTLDAIAQSLLRVKVEPKAAIVAPHNKYTRRVAPQAELDRVLSEVLYKAIGTICNLAELPECRLQIASNLKILEQFIAVMLTPTYIYIASLVTVAGMLCLAYSPETHPYLTQPKVMEGVMEAAEVPRSWTHYRITEEERRLDSMLLRYFATMFFAQLVTSSPHLLQPEQTLKLYHFVKNFLEKADYKEIREHEVKNGYIWSTMLPFMKLAYFPYSTPNHICSNTTHTDIQSSDVQTMTKLQELCVEAGIFSLQNMLSGAPAREILVEEGLVEYVTCLPWCTLPGSRAQEQAAELVSALGQKIQLHPPRLGTLTRAKLAAWHFGLEKVLQTLSVHELLAEVYQLQN